jgi:hypothetical protein
VDKRSASTNARSDAGVGLTRIAQCLPDTGFNELTTSYFHVSNLRSYGYAVGSKQIWVTIWWFEAAFNELTAKPIYKGLIPFDVTDVHNGYFSQDKYGHAKDARGNTADDEDTYHLIMLDKEGLLDPDVASRFIFSHSALREGWDNPNVFQICTLNESQAAERKRQEIGRGLRLPVNRSGERVHDETVNRLYEAAMTCLDNVSLTGRLTIREIHPCR